MSPSTAPHLAATPRLALVLGSGGVRSVAALGIAAALADAGVRPDLIAGCSSGALFGAIIATGLPSDEGLALARGLWSQELTEQRRWRAYAQLLAPRLAGFDDDFALRSDRLIAEAVRRGFAGRTFADLATPLRVAATDAASGTAVVLRDGSVADAVRASMALPFVFPPVRIGNRRLVDGVVSDPLPLRAAAEAAVAVTLGIEGTMPRRVRNPGLLLARVTTAMGNNLMHARIDAARAAGQRIVTIELVPERRIGLWQIDAMPYLFELGRRTAIARMPEILAVLDRAAPQRVAA